MAFQPSRTEQRVKYSLLALTLIAIAVVVALYFAPAFRLELAQRLRIVPGIDAIHVGSSDEYRLVVITERVSTELAGDRYRQVARYLVQYGDEQTVTDLASGQTFTIPVGGTPDVLLNAERTQLLFQTETAAAILDTTDNRVTPVEGQPTGDWSSQLYIRDGSCPGASPHDRYTVCVTTGRRFGTRYLFGDWQVVVRPFGTTTGGEGVFRGRGLIPIIGFAPDDRSIYIYSQYNIWQVPLD